MSSETEKREAMDLKFLSPLPSLPFSLVLSVFFSILMATMIMNKMKNTKRFGSISMPPGPTKLPIIGNLHNLVGDSFIPRRLQHLSGKHGPLMYLKLGEISTIVVSSSDIAMDFLKTHDLIFATRPTTLSMQSLTYDCTNISFCPYGEYWRQMKKICILELLSAKRVKAFTKLRQEEVASMIKSISQAADAGTPVNLSELFLILSNNIISRAAFGEKCKGQERLLVALNEGFELASGFNIGDFFPSVEFITAVVTGLKWRLGRVRKGFDSVFDEIIAEYLKKREDRKTEEEEEEEEQDDFLDILFRIKEKGGLNIKLTDDNIKAIILDMFGGGTETSSTTLEWIMSELIRNPETMRKAKSEVRRVCVGKSTVDATSISEMKYINLIIKENFRLHPPLPLLVPRECREDCELQGYKILKKTRVLVNMWAMGRDPNKWDDPEEFKPERFVDSPVDFRGTNFELIPFGAGRRICPALSFGLATVELALSELLFRYDWKMPCDGSGQELDMSAKIGLTMGRKNPLFLVPLHAKTVPT